MTNHVEITCERCKAKLDHRCSTELVERAIKLYSWVPECPPSFKKRGNPYYSPGDEHAPFLSEAYAYNLLGKEDARTLLALVNSLLVSVGLDPNDIKDRAGKVWEANSDGKQYVAAQGRSK